jgi:arylsulfatase A-like enzyme
VGHGIVAPIALSGAAEHRAWAGGGANSERPNIIYLMTDDQRWDSLGCYGNPEFKTHNIDKLAAEGVLFENCYYAVSICMPSRATVLTGQYMSRHRCGFDRPTNYTISRAEFERTYPAVLRRAGYRTGFIGKLGFAVTEAKQAPCTSRWRNAQYMPSDRFDSWKGWAGQAPNGGYWPKDYGLEKSYKSKDRPHLTDVMGDLIIGFVETNPADKPFCLSVSFHAPKGALTPGDVKPEYGRLFENVTFKLPRNYVAGANNNLPDLIKRNWRGLKYHQEYTWTPELYQKFVRRQAALAYGIDIVVGRLVKKLQERKFLGNTVIIFTSDNGFMNGSHGLDGKALLYEESMRAPLIVYDGRLPKDKRGRRLEELISTVDFASTIADLAGADIPGSMQGMSLKPLIEGRRTNWRDAVFMENNFTSYNIVPLEEARNDPAELVKTKRDSLRCHGIRTKRWKYVRFHELDPVLEQLFDLENDSLEQHDLAHDSKYGKVLKTMRERCAEIYAEVR